MSHSSQNSSQPLLSLCMIVKNESQNLPRCLASVKPYVDEMIVVDTGSTDNTPEIAIQYGAKVSNFEWCNDFAAARNYALSLVSGKWVLVLDADEELIVNSEDFLETLATDAETLAYFTIRTEADDVTMTSLHHIRLFRNLPEIQYIGVLHETLTYQDQPLFNYKIGYLDNIQMLHYGNNSLQLQEKNIHRNIPILEQARQENKISLKLLYCLAGFYNAEQQFEQAQECYAEAFEKLFPYLIAGTPPEDFSFIPSLVFTLAAQSLQNQDYETAQLLCQRGLEWCPNYPPINYIAGMTLASLGFLLGATAYLEECLELGQNNSYYKGEPFEHSFMTTEPACALGSIYLKLKDLEKATLAFELALNFDQNCQIAQENLKRIREILL
jgi:tetratricopeptide (TPR) repeat protein